MRFELRLIAAAALLLVVIALSCRRESIAEEKMAGAPIVETI